MWSWQPAAINCFKGQKKYGDNYKATANKLSSNLFAPPSLWGLTIIKLLSCLRGGEWGLWWRITGNANFHERFVPKEIYGMNVTCRLQDTFISGELAESLICIFTLFPLSPRAFHLLSKTASNETLSSIISYVYRLGHVHSMFDSPDIGDTCLQPTWSRGYIQNKPYYGT